MLSSRVNGRSAWGCTSQPARALAAVRLRSVAPPRAAAAASHTSAKNVDVPGAYPALLPLDGGYEDAHAFSTYANWIIPGRVMLGRYPYVEPSRCTTREQGEEQLEAIISAGITTFVSLQAEVPPQQDMRLAGIGGFLPYKATAELIHSAAVGLPPPEVISGLRNPTLDRFLPPRKRQQSALYQTYAAEGGLVFLHSPIEDLGLPSKDRLEALLHDLELRVAAGEALYVHCWGGRGRAGTVGACLLASMYGLSADEALQRVQRSFDTRRDNQRRSPETDAQFEFVRDFAASLKQ